MRFRDFFEMDATRKRRFSRSDKDEVKASDIKHQDVDDPQAMKALYYRWLRGTRLQGLGLDKEQKPPVSLQGFVKWLEKRK